MSDKRFGRFALQRFNPALFAYSATGVLAIWLGFPNDVFSLPPLVLLWPLALSCIGLKTENAQQAFVFGLLTNFLGMVLALYWLAIPISVVGGLPWPCAAACMLLVSLALAAILALHSFFAFFCKKVPDSLLPIALALIWVLLEEGNAVVAGFPWLPISGALVVWPVLVQTAAYVGMYGTAFFWLLAVFSFLPLLCHKKKALPKAAFGFSLVAFLLLAGTLHLKNAPFDPAPQGEDSFGVLFIEGNFDQNQKWVPSLQKETLARYRVLTERGLRASGDQSALVVWPETAMPFFLETKPLLAREVYATAQEHAVPLLFGAPGTDLTRRLPDGSHPVFNRASLLSPEGLLLGTYDKEHLVPFGEYTPAFLDFAFLRPLLQSTGVYTVGENKGPLRFGDNALGMLICYEGIFPWLADRRVEEGANILCDISNDGWFARTPASRQHLYLTALRAVEQGRWLLRGTNSGISAVIDAQGRITCKGPLFTEGFIYARAKRSHTETFFHTHASLLLYAFPACGLLVLLFTLPLRKKARQKES